MLVLLYQLTIVGTLLLTRILAPKRLQAACLIWTAFTVINLFWPPLIVLQLLVIWVTFALIKPSEAPGGKATPGPGGATPTTSADTRPAPARPSEPAHIGTRRSTLQPVSPADAGLADPPVAQAEPSPEQKLRREIEEISVGREIPLLAHFTRARNLQSIFEHGLCSIVTARGAGINPRVNDRLRLDGHPEAVSLSIAFPNHRMFYSYRQKDPEEEWVVLLIDPAILWKKRCGFCQRNAADHRVRDLPLASLTHASALRGLFDPVDGVPTRLEQQLLDCDPTDPQAEVLVFDTIEPGFIQGVAFDSHAVQAACARLLEGRQWQVFDRNAGPFGSRGYSRT